MSSEITANIERLILEAWDMGLVDVAVTEYVLSEVTISRDIVETIINDLMHKLS